MTATESQARTAALGQSDTHTRELFDASQAALRHALDELDRVTGEKERAIAWAVRLEQENAHILDASDEAITRLCDAYRAGSFCGGDEQTEPGIRAVLATLGGTE